MMILSQLSLYLAAVLLATPTPILVQTCFNYFYVPMCSYNSFIVSFWKHLLHIQKWLACVFSYLQLLNENVNERSLWLSHELSTLFFYSNFLLNPQRLGNGAVSGKEGTLIIMLSMGVSYQQFFELFLNNFSSLFFPPFLSHCLWNMERGSGHHLEKCRYLAAMGR